MKPIKLMQDVKLNVKPIYVTLYHEYVFEGPCRMGAGEELTKEYDQMMNAGAVKATENEIIEMIGDTVNLMPGSYIDRDERFMITDEMLDDMLNDSGEVDVYAVNALSRFSDIILEFAQRVKKPILIVPSGPCLHLETAAPLLARGLEIYSYRTWEQALDFLEAMRIKKALAVSRVLCAPRFGTTRSISAGDNFIDLETVTAKLGTQFRFVNIHELIDQTNAGNPTDNNTLPGRKGLNPTEEEMLEIDSLADKMISEAEECDMTKEDVLSSLRAYLTIEKMLATNECNMFAAPCPDACATRRLNEERYTFCLAHSLLEEKGISSACEYDIPAALSKAILSGFAQAPAYMGNTTQGFRMMPGEMIPPFFDGSIDNEYPSKIKDPHDTLFIWHAVPNRCMKGYGCDHEPYALRPFTTSGFGATIRYDFDRDAGQIVTVCRIDPACSKIFVGKGEIITGRGYNDFSCSEGVFIKIADGDDWYKKQLHFGNHLPLVYGDYTEKVSLLGNLLGLEVITA